MHAATGTGLFVPCPQQKKVWSKYLFLIYKYIFEVFPSAAAKYSFSLNFSPLKFEVVSRIEPSSI